MILRTLFELMGEREEKWYRTLFLTFLMLCSFAFNFGLFIILFFDWPSAYGLGARLVMIIGYVGTLFHLARFLLRRRLNQPGQIRVNPPVNPDRR